MRREGRQHGMVLTFFTPSRSDDMECIKKKLPKRVDGPLMGAYSKAPSKPTNSSRYTSRCGLPRCQNCHDNPVTKARAKTKGNHKHKDEISDFYLKGDRNRSDEACEMNYDSDASGGSDGEELICPKGGVGGGDCEDGEWVLVEGV